MNQNDAILEYLKQGYSLTPLEALQKLNCMRLSGRIYDLKAQGHDIRMEFVKSSNKKFARYYLKRPSYETEENGQLVLANC